jgi:hypothetical protein
MTASPIFIGVAVTMDEDLFSRYDALRRNAGVFLLRNLPISIGIPSCFILSLGTINLPQRHKDTKTLRKLRQ